ncbi:MAG: DUF4147 domain-containing protein [Gammaproteobacteria bacterium]|nr:DUF4147 domain-containing protein [Gammaproteobacteria bacterium]NIR83082.1 DUF4147 domain-containing protein [Gammaproteobacteria bacterium]NIR90744.1 DUF4147 domain-containing protein [Gammaproteobacteria bacterium]NIU04235.1 DUF4147 domain-containing protein [Gammaproteobacteria bacterium]NIV51527.1 DUF4147 domain-containing protein [Gammaproteobacteria bacterium]
MSEDEERQHHRRNLLAIYRTALEAVDGRLRVRQALHERQMPSPLYAVAIGKAATSMMAGACDALGGGLASGLVITKGGYAESLFPAGAPVRCLEASHPVPDESSLVAGRELLEFIADAPSEASFLFLVSGGASSLVEVLPEGLGTDFFRRTNEWLLASGLPIGAMNRVRKRVSCIKGGRLACYLNGRAALNLLVSDVPGDDPRVIGSGLLIPHHSEDLGLRGICLPEWLDTVAGKAPPLPPRSAFRAVRSEIVARPADAGRAAARAGEEYGYTVYVYDDLVTGEAGDAGRQIVQEVTAGPTGLRVWMGETTVHLPPRPGRGGRCQSLALAAAMEMAGRTDLYLLAVGTDGTDGPGQDAGALVDGGTVERGCRSGLEPEACLAAADAGSFLEASGDLVHTGPTGTNVMDLHLVLKTP